MHECATESGRQNLHRRGNERAFLPRSAVSFNMIYVVLAVMWRRAPVAAESVVHLEARRHITKRYRLRRKTRRSLLSFQTGGPPGSGTIAQVARALALVARSISAYTFVVSTDTCPSHARMVLMSTPARSRWVAVV